MSWVPQIGGLSCRRIGSLVWSGLRCRLSKCCEPQGLSGFSSSALAHHGCMSWRVVAHWAITKHISRHEASGRHRFVSSVRGCSGTGQDKCFVFAFAWEAGFCSSGAVAHDSFVSWRVMTPGRQTLYLVGSDSMRVIGSCLLRDTIVS
jgi:hypothetical protein